MGITVEYSTFVDSIIQDLFPYEKNLKMLELGDQLFDDGKTGKEFYQEKGYEHISVDLNGENGSIIKDLSKENEFIEWHGYFDIITNFGTTEHVEPLEAQYTVFKIIHDCLSVGGIAIHLNPDVDARDTRGLWKKHCRYYYSDKFYTRLVKFSDYRLLRNQEINGLRAAAYLKLGKDFISPKERLLEKISIREGRLGGVQNKCVDSAFQT